MPESDTPNGEVLLTAAVATITLTSLVVWLTGGISSTITNGRWPPASPLQAPLITLRLLQAPADPAAAWPTAAQPHIPRPLPYYTTLLVLLLTVALIAHLTYSKWHSHSVTDGDARWAKPADLDGLVVSRPQPGRVILGRVGRRLVATEKQHSVAVIGPAGSGKTTGLAIPALLEWDGPIIATSVKTDLLSATVGWRHNQGHVWIYDPSATTGLPTAGWNPLGGCGTWQGALRMASWLVRATHSPGRRGTADSDFWYAVAQKLLAPLLHAAALHHTDMTDVTRWVDLQDHQQPIEILHTHGAEDALQALIATVNREDRARSSAYTTTETVLAAFTDPAVTKSTTHTPTYTPGGFLNGGNHTLYICAPLHEQTRLQPLFTALLQQTISHIYQHAAITQHPLTPPVLLLIDEAANIAPLPNLPQLASTARGVGIQLITIWQDLTQLHTRYGQAAQTIINNHRALIALPGINDPTTLHHLTPLIGTHHTTSLTRTRNHNKPDTITETPKQQPLAPDATIRRIPQRTGILIHGNYQPTRIKLRSNPASKL